MAKRGRPEYVIDDKVLKKVEDLAAHGLTKQQIALALGIHVATLCKKRLENAELTEAIKRGEANGIKTVTNALFTAAREGNITAQIFFLKNRDPENWKDRQYVDETRRIIPADVEINKDMTPQQAAETYADTLRNGSVGNVVPIKRRRG